MSTSYAGIRVPPSLALAYLAASVLGYGTATTLEFRSVEQRPTATFDLDAVTDSSHNLALDWLELSKEVQQTARSLTPEERASINEFFWSHFQ